MLEVTKENPENIECYLSMLLNARHLERIADLSTNISEDVIYLAEGRIIRHGNANLREEDITKSAPNS